MVQIDNLTDDADQKTTIVLEDGSSVTLELFFRPAIERWTVDVTYGTELIVKGMTLTLHPNILRGWRNLIPFGMMVYSIDGGDPYYIDDFSSQRIKLYIMDSTEVESVETETIGAF
jgi:hypothetical protein